MESSRDNPDARPHIAPEGGIAASGEHEPRLDQGAPEDSPMVEAAQLFGRHRQIVIGHNGCRYVLRITKHGKLILNK